MLRNARAASVWAGLLVLAGCGELASNGGEGADCVRSAQCEPGLACVPVAPGASERVCSGDPSNLMGEVPEIDGGAEAGMAMADGGGDGGPPMGTDSGPMEMDSGPMGTDSGPMEMDSGPMGTDSGPMGMDSGPMGMDSGSGASDAATD